MKERDFGELLESVKEVGLITAGKLLPSREIIVERKIEKDSSNVETLAICLSTEDEGLIPLKIYHIVLQPVLKTCTVKNENHETSVCPIDGFLPVEFPSQIEKRLEETELALA